ncbi:MAG: hypothetical protein AABW73_01565 [Nanoarchaeota archaeon]
MNFKPTKWKVIAVLVVLLLTRLAHFLFLANEDSNLLVMSAPGIFAYVVWSFFEKKK